MIIEHTYKALMFVTAMLAASLVFADSPDMETEVDVLLTAIGQSNCEFIRNNKPHSATEAESHLRMKFRRGRKYFDTSEQFIERIASKSSWSSDPYWINCPGALKQLSGEWLTQRLAEIRGNQGL